MSVRVVGGLLVSRRRVGALGDSTVGLVSRVPSRMCWVGCCVAAFRFWGHSVPGASWLAGVCEVRSCWRRGRRGLPLHLLGNDGGQRRARGMISRERSVVLRGATSSTRFVARGGDAAGGEVADSIA